MVFKMRLRVVHAKGVLVGKLSTMHHRFPLNLSLNIIALLLYQLLNLNITSLATLLYLGVHELVEVYVGALLAQKVVID